MAKGQFHIGPKGPAPCGANPDGRGCPFEKDSTDNIHFDTMDEAQQAYEERLEADHGLFSTESKAPATQAPPTPVAHDSNSNGARMTKEQLQTTVDTIVTDTSYCMSKDANGFYTGDSSECLQRFYDQYMEKTEGDHEPELIYEDEDATVIRSVYIPELDLEIENDNYQEDLNQIAEYQEQRSDENLAYWRSVL